MPMMASFVLGQAWIRGWALNAVMMLFVALMMVSRVPTFSLKRIRVSHDWFPAILLIGGVTVVLLVTETWLTLSVIGLVYLGSIPASVIVARRLRRAEEAAAATAGRDQEGGRDRIVAFEARPPRPDGPDGPPCSMPRPAA